MNEIEIFIAGRSDGEALSDGLRALTKAICDRFPDKEASFGLGGEDGYGADFENDVFLMHRYCGCEREDCPWCSGCNCEAEDNIEHYIDGVTVTWEAQWEWRKGFLGPLPHELYKHGSAKYIDYAVKWDARVEEANRRQQTFYPAVTHSCTPVGLMTNRGRSEETRPSQLAPNFWHKPSGLKVWWYKWIGRDNEAEGSCTALSAMFVECIASLRDGA